MKKKRRTTAGAALLAAVSAALGGRVEGEVEIVRNGRPAAVILVADDATPVAHEAAAEFARVVEKASGAQLRIYPESEFIASDPGFPAERAWKVLIGDTETGRKLGIDVSQLPPEGFLIRTRDRYLALAGRGEPYSDWGWRGHRQPQHLRGTWHAVCTFLEDYLGVRWLWPEDRGEVVPPTLNIRVGDIDRVEAPALATRALRANHFYGGSMHHAAGEMGLDLGEQFAMMEELIRWVDHQRLGSSLAIAHSEFSNRWLEQFAADHPDWFALQPSGKRLLTFGGGYRVRMCLSHPEVIEEVVRRVIEYLDAHPHLSGYGIAPSDVYGHHCVCERCRKWGPTVSDLVAHHAAAVADRVAELRPGKYVHALAYDKYNDAPQSDVRFGDNVVLSYVGVDYFGYLCERVRQKSIAEWDGWARVAPRIIWRPNNYCLTAGVPRVYVTRLGEDFRHFHRHRMIGVDFDRLQFNWALDGLNYYVTARLTWNPQTPVEGIVDDYCTQGFGPAAPAVKEYFALLERITDRIAGVRESDRNDREIPGYYTREDLTRLRQILNQAAQLAAGDEEVSSRVAFLAEGLEIAELEVPLSIAVRRAGERKPTPEERATLRELLTKRAALLRQRRASWAIGAVSLSRRQDWLEEQLFAPPQPGPFDDLPNAYREIMELPATWKFHLDPNLKGEEEKWYTPEYDDAGWQEIRVGEFWEKQGFPDYDSAAWYRLKIPLPPELEGSIVQLCFGAADENARVYVNGKLSGEFDLGPQGWDQRFFIDITEEIQPGATNLIAVRVIDSVGAGGLWKPVRMVTPKTVLYPIKDTWLRRNYPGTAYGKDPSLAVGVNDYFRAVLAWQLPEKVRIQKARLIMPLRYQKGLGSYALYPVLEDWYEPQATWNGPFGAEPWQGAAGAGAGISGDPIARVQHGPLDEEEARQSSPPPALALDLSPLARAWAQGKDNFGVLMVQDPPDEKASCALHSREAEDPLRRPRLELELAPLGSAGGKGSG